jgi:hypothetical protein
MNGYFQIVDETQAYKASIWPKAGFSEDQIVFVGDKEPFKIWGLWDQRIQSTFGKYPEAQRDFFLNLVGLNDDERVIAPHSRRWRQISFGICWRATLAIGLLDSKMIFSLPNQKDFAHYWLVPGAQSVWEYLMDHEKVVLVSRSQSAWLDELRYSVKQ